MILEWLQMALAVMIVIPCILLAFFAAGIHAPQQD